MVSPASDGPVQLLPCPQQAVSSLDWFLRGDRRDRRHRLSEQPGEGLPKKPLQDAASPDDGLHTKAPVSDTGIRRVLSQAVP